MAKLVSSDPDLWLSRSWTTRARRPHEPESAYVFVDRREFMDHVSKGGFLEWAEFADHLYGTPMPENAPGTDVVLEIDVQGAAQVRRQHPDALVIFLVPPSPHEQAARLRARGDDEEHVAKRLELAAQEDQIGRELADAVVVNDDLDQAVAEVARILNVRRGDREPHDPRGR